MVTLWPLLLGLSLTSATTAALAAIAAAAAADAGAGTADGAAGAASAAGARWAGVAEADLLWDRDANQVLIEAKDDLGQRIQSMQSICDDAIARVGAAGPLDPGTLPSCASRTSRVLVVTHGDLINRFTPGFDFDPSIGRYCASECGWLACTGFAPLPAYDGDTVELSSVPRVLAVEGVETM